ncbi:MAG: MFS transporter [Clostridiales Family XIII bacterium]|nr:MFS transporter [Clostridiales Family XIII bacterium]
MKISYTDGRALIILYKEEKMDTATVNGAPGNQIQEYSKSRWFIMIAMMVSWIGQGAQLLQFAPVVGSVAEEFGLTAGQVSFYGMGLYSLVMGITAIIGGFLIDRFGASQFVLVCMAILFSMALLTPVMTQSLSGIIALRLICGAATGPIISAAAPLGVQYFPVKNRSIFMGVVGAGFPLGMTLSLLIMGVRLGQTGGDWRMSMFTISILPAIALVFIIAMIAVMRKIKTDASASDAVKDNLTAKTAFTAVIRAPLFYLLIVANICMSWGKNGFTDLSPGYIALEPPTGLGYGAEYASYISMLITIGMIIGSFVAGFLIDKVFKSRARPWLLIAFAILAICIMLTKFGFITSNTAVFSVVLFLVGFSVESLGPGLTGTVMTRFPPNVTAKVYGLCFGVGLFAASGGVMIGSMVLHVTSSYQGVLLLLSIIAVVGFVLALFFNKAKAIREDKKA